MPDLSRRGLLCRGCALAALAGCEGFNSVPPEAAVDTGGGPSGSTGSDDGSTGTGFRCDTVAQPGAPGWVAVPLAEHPELDAVGGWVQLSLGGQSVNVAQVEAGCFVAMATSCTHQGARVDYVPERGQFVCSLHGAVYVPDGTPILGPTEVPLETWPCALDGDTVWVDLG